MCEFGRGENLAGAGEQRRRFRRIVAGTDVGQVEPFRAGIAGEAGGFVGGAVSVACGERFFAPGKRRLMHDEVGIVAKIGVRVVVAGVAKNHHAALDAGRRAVIGAVQHATIAEGMVSPFFNRAYSGPAGTPSARRRATSSAPGCTASRIT